jgi:acetyl-CoA C-acetyltransferase
VPVQVKAKRETVECKVDEHVRRDVVRDVFSKLRPAFREVGTVTAGNAAGVNDAGAAVIVMSSRKAEELGAPVRARILSWAVCGVEPKAMGIGPVPVVRRALERAGKTLEDVDVIELNEAFAAQSLALMSDLDLDPAKVNPNGGAIALRHRARSRTAA